MGNLQADTYGIPVDLNTATDLTGVTSTSVMVQSPSGVETELSAIIVDVANGVVNTTFPAGVLAESGYYFLQVVADTGTSRRIRSKKFRITVEDSIIV